MEKNKVYDVKYLNGRQILRPDTDGQSGSSVTPNPSTSPDDPRLTGLEVDGSKFKLDYATAEDVSGLSDKVEQDESEIESQGTRLTNAEETIVSQGNSINDNATAISNEVSNREAAITALANNVYAKADTYNKTEVDDMIAAIHQFEFEVVEELPEPTEEVFNARKIYLVPKEGSGEDYYNEYVCVRDDQGFKFEKIGNTEVDLSNYYTKGETDSKFALANDLTALSGSLTTEVARAQGVEASLQTAVENEASTARAAESANATAIANEATRAQAAEAANAGAVTAETNRAEAAEAGLQTAINNFVKANPEMVGNEADLSGLEVNGVKYKVGEQTPVYEHQIQLNYYFESDSWINITGYIFLIDNDPTPVELPRDFSRLVGVYQPKRRCCLSVMQEGGRGVLDLCAFRDRDDVITLIGYGAEYNSSNVITEFYSLNHELNLEFDDSATYDVTDNVVQIV